MKNNKNYEQEPQILDVTPTDSGEYRLNINKSRAQDIFATLRFHIPDEAQFNEKLSILFDNAVNRGMLKDATIIIDDIGNEAGIENIQFHRMLAFDTNTTPEQAREALQLAYCHIDDITIQEIEEKVLTGFIDSNRMPANGITFQSSNEIVTATIDEISYELDQLTYRYYNGQPLGGPISE